MDDRLKGLVADADKSLFRRKVYDNIHSITSILLSGAGFIGGPAFGMATFALVNPIFGPFGNGYSLNPLVKAIDKLIPDSMTGLKKITQKRFVGRWDNDLTTKREWFEKGYRDRVVNFDGGATKKEYTNFASLLLPEKTGEEIGAPDKPSPKIELGYLRKLLPEREQSQLPTGHTK